MLEFYEFNTFNICVVLISTFVIYYLLCNFFKDKNGSENENRNENGNRDGNELNFEYLLISVLIAICISIGFFIFLCRRVMKAILTENFWDNNQFE